MTIEDAKSFIKQCRELDWIPNKISIIGGEPTLHKDFDEFIELALEFVGNGMVEVWSNMYGKIPNQVFKKYHHTNHGIPSYRIYWSDEGLEGKDLIPFSKPKRDNLSWQYNTIKDKSVHFYKGMTISPKDMGFDSCPPDNEENKYGCYQHSGLGSCGISVDSVGYSICAMGGAIDGMLGLNVRTKDLSKLFDKDFALKQTCDLCDNCGYEYDKRTNEINWESRDNVKVVNHTNMSSTWYNALNKHKEK